MNTAPFLPYAKQSITQEEAAEIAESLTADIITRGPKVEEFEHSLCEYCSVSFGVAFNNATTALQAACYAAKTNDYDKLITTPNTFVATVSAGIHFDASIVFADIDPSTANIDIEQVALALREPKSRGRSIVIPVHFAGVPVDMEMLNNTIVDPETIVIEDAAHALGSSYPDGTKVGSCINSHMTIFSFHPAKNITTGEGGMVMTNDPELCYRLRLFRNNGIERDPSKIEGEQGPWIYEVQDITGNYNFTDFQAALGLSQLKKLDLMLQKRVQVLEWYQQRLGGLRPDLHLLTPQPDKKVAYHLCVVRINYAPCRTDRATVMSKLKAQGIGTQVHYIPVYRHPYFKRMMGDLTPYFSETEKYYSEALTLPLYPDLQEADVDRICNALRQALGR